MKIILTGLIILGLLIGGYFLLLLPSVSDENLQTASDEMSTNQVTSANNDSEEFSGVGALIDLKNRGANLECSFIYSPNEFESDITGTYFVSNGSVRGDFVTAVPDMGGEVLTSLIIDQNNVYIWSTIEGEMFGTKTQIEETIDTTKIQTPVALDVAVRYNCKPWTQIDGSVFVPPSSVLFKATTDISKSNMEYGTVYEEGEF